MYFPYAPRAVPIGCRAHGLKEVAIKSLTTSEKKQYTLKGAFYRYPLIVYISTPPTESKCLIRIGTIGLIFSHASDMN